MEVMGVLKRFITMAYADDCYVLLSGKRNEVTLQFRLVKEIFREFEEVTGLALNISKTEIITVGPELKSATNLDGI